MNYDQITGIIRAVMPALLAWFSAKGMPLNEWESIGIVVGVTIAACAWSIVNNQTGKTIK